MKKIKINFGKVAFLMCNFIFLLSGICLVLLGCVLVNDAPRILLSQLVVEPGVISQPLLYYAALVFIAVGLIVCAVALLGCWTSWNPESNWLIGTYMFLLIILLLMETSFGAVASLCPQIIGVVLDRDQMVTGLMNNYGVPGRSQYTAAVDLAQTLFECCGMQSGSDYDGSKWWKREQETMHDLRVPHSCCFISNTDDENSFLDPKPINSSLCQAKTNSRYQYGRHVKGCIDKLNAWFKDHITIFLIIGLALVVVQLAVLLCAILVCLRKRNPPVSTSSSVESSFRQSSDSSKKLKQPKKSPTPKPERKNASAQIDIQHDNGFIVGENQDSFDFHANLKSMKSPNLHEFSDGRGRDSPSSLPLVLRNDHFWKYDDFKNKSHADSTRKNSPITQKTRCYNQESNVYFTPHYRSTGRKDKTSHSKEDNIKLNEDMKNYFIKNDNYGVDNNRGGSDEKNDKLIDNYFGSAWVPSRQSGIFQNPVDPEPWNTVGIPTKEISSPLKCRDDNQIVRKAVRDIESGLYNKDYQDRRKDIIEEKIDITKAKLYWLEKEKKSSDQTSSAPVPADFYTDYPAEGERDENVIVLKLEQSDGVILKPDASILLTPVVSQRRRRTKESSKSSGKTSLETEKENLPDYERNWTQKRNDLWESDSVKQSPRYFRRTYSDKDTVASRILKFQSLNYPNEVGRLPSQIPRVKAERICRGCSRIIEREICLGCHKLKADSRKYQTLLGGEGLFDESKFSKDDSLWFTLNPQRSRKNFFGNSGSYTLRCNLNPISKINSGKKKFYLTPETLQLGYLKKLKEPKIMYENFTAKKREFKKHRAGFTQFEGLKKYPDTVMW